MRSKSKQPRLPEQSVNLDNLQEVVALGCRFYLVHATGGGFLAVYRRCTHLGCSVNWEAEQNSFFCPCHASTFDMHGEVESPTAPVRWTPFPCRSKQARYW